MNETSLLSLPSKPFLDILYLLPPKDLLSLCKTSKQLDLIVGKIMRWRDLTQKDFPSQFMSLYKALPLNSHFKQVYLIERNLRIIDEAYKEIKAIEEPLNESMLIGSVMILGPTVIWRTSLGICKLFDLAEKVAHISTVKLIRMVVDASLYLNKH